MQQKSSSIRWLLLFWLIISQLGSISLMFLPTIILLAIGTASMETGGFSILPGVACIAPLLFITLSGTAWIAFIRKQHKQALILTTVALTVGAITYFGIDLYTRYINP